MPTITQQTPVYLFPNPANNEIQIPVEWFVSMEKTSLQTKIMDLSGRVVQQSIIQNIGEAYMMNVSHLANGVYILSLSDSSGLSHTGKFIIKR